MTEFLHALAQQLGVSASFTALAGVGVGTFIVLASLFGTLGRPDPVTGRLRAGIRADSRAPAVGGLMNNREAAPKGIMKPFLPGEEEERSEIRLKLSRAGVRSRNAVRNYFLIRTLLGLVVPALVLGLIVASPWLNLPDALDQRIGRLTTMQTLQIVAVVIAIGFYGPVWWLRSRVAAHRQKMEQEFPAALDLLQVSVEAGMGLDAAISRVARELADVAPGISTEFVVLQNELVAGRDRSSAMFAMARRMGIDEASSFVNVILQSMQYGSSISDALQIYATEMRHEREMRAQEKANKLPVQMSGVMASLMLPALLMITLGPVVIRYVRYFAAN